METAEAYQKVRGRMLDLVTEADPATPVPTCPGWTIKELLAHVTGVAAQVAARADRSFDDVAAEWTDTGPQVDDLCVALGDGIAQLVFDTVTHEQDLRGALGNPGGEDGAVEVALRWAAGAWAGSEVPTAGTLLIRSGAVEAIRGDGEPVVAVELAPLDAMAVMTGRRSLSEVRALAWDGDVEPWLPAFTWGPFVPPT